MKKSISPRGPWGHCQQPKPSAFPWSWWTLRKHLFLNHVGYNIDYGMVEMINISTTWMDGLGWFSRSGIDPCFGVEDAEEAMRRPGRFPENQGLLLLFDPLHFLLPLQAFETELNKQVDRNINLDGINIASENILMLLKDVSIFQTFACGWYIDG